MAYVRWEGEEDLMIMTPFTPSLSDKFLRAFQTDFNHIIVEMIARPKIEGSQSWHHRPSPPTCFDSNEEFESSLVTAERGERLAALYFWPSYHFNNYITEISLKGL